MCFSMNVRWFVRNSWSYLMSSIIYSVCDVIFVFSLKTHVFLYLWLPTCVTSRFSGDMTAMLHVGPETVTNVLLILLKTFSVIFSWYPLEPARFPHALKSWNYAWTHLCRSSTWVKIYLLLNEAGFQSLAASSSLQRTQWPAWWTITKRSILSIAVSIFFVDHCFQFGNVFTLTIFGRNMTFVVGKSAFAHMKLDWLMSWHCLYRPGGQWCVL